MPRRQDLLAEPAHSPPWPGPRGISLLKIAYAVLKAGRPYQEPGADFYTRRETAQARRDYLLRQLQKLNPGYVITITPAEAA